MRHRITPRSPRHRNGGDRFLTAFANKLGFDGEFSSYGPRARNDLFSFIATDIVPIGLEGSGLDGAAKRFRNLPHDLGSFKGFKEVSALVNSAQHEMLDAAPRRFPSRAAVQRAVSNYYKPTRGFPRSFEETHPEADYGPELSKHHDAIYDALQHLRDVADNNDGDIVNDGPLNAARLADVVLGVIDASDPSLEDGIFVTVFAAIMQLEEGPIPVSRGRVQNPAFTTGELQRMQREVDRLMFPDGLSGKPKAKPKPTYEIELRKGDHVEVYKFKTKKEAVARFEESAAKAEASNDPRFAGVSISLYCGGALTEQYRKATKKATKRK